MPALPKLRIEALSELARELRFESPAAARRQLFRAEALALEVLADRAPDRLYPLEYVRLRITGLPPESDRDPASPSGASVSLVGQALLADLGALVERLSDAAGLREEELRGAAPAGAGAAAHAARRARPAGNGRSDGEDGLGGPWLSVPDLCARWSVGPRTLQRLRRRGLLARRVRAASRPGAPARGAAARQVLLFSLAAVEAFERSGILPAAGPDASGGRTAQVRAARAPRLSDADRAEIIRRATRYRARLGWTLNRCAVRIAPRVGRTVETVRRALRKHDLQADQPMFTERGPLSEHERAAVERSRRAGADPKRVRERLGRSAASIHRAWLCRRVERLREIELHGWRGPLFDLPDAPGVHLAPEVVRTGLGAGAPRNVDAFLAACRAMEPPVAGTESARAVAYWFLRHRAAASVARLDLHHPQARAIDAIETDLRWASRLKAELVRSQLPTVLRSIRARTGDDASIAPSLLELCIAALAESVEKFDPFKALATGARLAAPATIAVNRAVTRWLAERGQAPPGRAVRRQESAPLSDWTLRVDEWQAWLEPDAPIAEAARLGAGEPWDPRALQAVQARYGLGSGRPPMTTIEAARLLRTTPSALTGLERRVLAAWASGRPIGEAARG